MEAETTNTVASETSDRSSVEVKPLSASESIVIEEDDKAFLDAISVCCKCRENLCDKESKFLSCLHTFCTPCIKQLEVNEGLFNLPFTNYLSQYTLTFSEYFIFNFPH